MAKRSDVEAKAKGMRARMVERLDRNGEAPRPWREALWEVPRHAFVPLVVWHGTSRGYVPLYRSDDVDAWLGLAYADRPVVAQVDDGRPRALLGRFASSTMPSPYELGVLLSAVDAQPGMRACEIGTGTGYTAAVLAHRLGGDAVTTVEVDAGLARLARRRLRPAGVRVVTADGTHGFADRAAYDRLVCTATVRDIPYAWVRQVRPGGVIVTSWGTPYHAGALLRLVVRDDGTAVGRIVAAASCEWLRSQRVPAALTVAEHEAALARTATTTTDLNDIGADLDVCTAIGLRVPGCATVFLPPDDHWFVDADTGSWARLHLRPAGAHLVNQYGPRDLWDEVTAAHRWWYEHDCPDAGAWRFTVTPDGIDIKPAHLQAAA